MRPRPNRCHFADDIFKRIFFNENVRISIKISLKFVPKGPINSIGSDNDLAPTRRQAIIWTNGGLFYWRIYASLGLNGLKDHKEFALRYLIYELWERHL